MDSRMDGWREESRYEKYGEEEAAKLTVFVCGVLN
jgi:hypothetical protein